jgi:23S rRNA maturation mini-RNase III
MVVRQPRYSKEEFARGGDAIYESQVRSRVTEKERVLGTYLLSLQKTYLREQGNLLG